MKAEYDSPLPTRLINLHFGEEILRKQSFDLISGSKNLKLHLSAVEAAMDLADLLRQFPTTDDDLRVIQLLGMRIFNAFGSALKLSLSGYSQNSALIMRDILETVFLINYFSGDRSQIKRWRFADDKVQRNEFSPVKIREALDARDGFTGKKRFEIYKMFSELAGHPNMKSSLMMRPQRGGDVVIGPFLEATTLDATISEMGRLAVQVGEQLNLFFSNDWEKGIESRLAFARVKQHWIATFYPKSAPPDTKTSI